MDVYQRRRLVALSAVVGVFVVVVLAVASGGGDDEAAPVAAVTGPTGEQGQQALGKRDYIARADRICAEANASLETIDATDLAQAAQTEARIVGGQLQQLRTLPPPNRDRQLANRYLRELRAQVEALRDRQVAVERNDDAALIEIDGTLATAEAEAQEAAQEFGFEVCGDPEALGDPELDDAGVPVEPAPVDPAAPVEPAPAPVEPAPPPVDEGGGTPPDTGGVEPDPGSGGVSP